MDDQGEDDFREIVAQAMKLPEPADALARLGWSAEAILGIEADLLHDEALRRRVEARFRLVADRAAVLETHIRQPPDWRRESLRALPRRARLTLIAALAWPLLVATAVVTVAVPGLGLLLRGLLVLTIAATLPRFEPITRFLLRRSLPASWWQRMQWGRGRRSLRRRVWRSRLQWRRDVRDEIVLPHLRERINRAAERRFDHALTLRGHRSVLLGGAPSFLVTTEAMENLAGEIARTHRGAIGLAGARGVGKSTMLSALQNGLLPTARRLTVLVSAPTRYELRDFVLHLHTVLGKAVLAELPPLRGRTPAGQDRWTAHYRALRRSSLRSAMVRYFLRGTAVALIAVALAALIHYHDLRQLVADYPAAMREVLTRPASATQPVSNRAAAAAFLTVGLVAGAFHLIALILVPFVASDGNREEQLFNAMEKARRTWLNSHLRFRLHRRLSTWCDVLGLPWQPLPLPEPPARPSSVDRYWEARRHRFADQRQWQRRRSLPLRALALLADENLKRIRFLQTHTTGWSGKVEAPRGMGLAVSRSLARAEQPLTQPEVVAELRDFLERAAFELRHAGIADGITVAIDELDKMLDPADVHEFVNDLKTVFTVDHTVFLVSVSEDALAAFDRRGVPIRDALDSAFTTIIPVEPFTFTETRQWLDQQLIGLPSPFDALCHALCAGIPRELARTAATFLDVIDEAEDEPPRLAALTRRLVAADIAGKLRAYTHAAHQLSADAATLIVALNTVAGLTHPREDDLPRRLQELASWLADYDVPDDDRTLRQLSTEIRALCRLGIALCEAFTDATTAAGVETLLTPDRNAPIDLLARARRALNTEPQLTLALLDRFRAAYRAPA
ncbi:hypothetical protein [Amycolatopsis sp. NPDC051102]|uniref:hypothetical protein n=1 Tax=Amycolatopsis sp. NPDC051102 TaxID=3155163 RepID=UPI00342D8CBE